MKGRLDRLRAGAWVLALGTTSIMFALAPAAVDAAEKMDSAKEKVRSFGSNVKDKVVETKERVAAAFHRGDGRGTNDPSAVRAAPAPETASSAQQAP
jgi:hypothetical protein